MTIGEKQVCDGSCRTGRRYQVIAHFAGTGLNEKHHMQFENRTDSFAGLAGRIDLVAVLTLALVTAHLIDTDLTAGFLVFTLINICMKKLNIKLLR